MTSLSHTDASGKAHMVDVGGKSDQLRIARAEGFIRLKSETLALIRENALKKGDVLTVAEIAGIQGAKRTSELIPLCHPLTLTQINVTTDLAEEGIRVWSEVRCIGKTGVEMEALMAVQVALLSIYDMCKAVDKEMEMGRIRLIGKIKTDPE